MSKAVLNQPVATSRITSHVDTLDSHDTLVEQFGKFVYDKTRGGHILTAKEAARYIQTLKDGAEVREKDVNRWISDARKYVAANLSHYIIRVPNQGWRIAVGSERPRYLSKITHITKKWIDLLLTYSTALNASEIPSYYRDYQLKYQRNLKGSSAMGDKFSVGLLTYLKKEKDKVKNEQKLIESN